MLECASLTESIKIALLCDSCSNDTSLAKERERGGRLANFLVLM